MLLKRKSPELTDGEDPEEHAQGMQDFLDQGAMRIFAHSGRQGQQRAVDFYGSEVLPLLRS
ncbi:MAG: hypothetical protein M3122_09755 [Actinomycetota bacterium]|nr:hypothetical protein [Actinomycetota bacterium]